MTHYKVRAPRRPRRASPQPKGCDERGCREPWTVEGWLFDLQRGDILDGRYCGPHAESNGFCRFCGVHAAGTEGFDFGQPAGLCDNCRSSASDDVDEWDDEGTGDPDLDVLEHGFDPGLDLMIDEPGRIVRSETNRLIDDALYGGRR
jgi:hypothetical protein